MLSENKKTHTFFLKIEIEMMKKMVDLWVKHGESVRETNEEDNEQLEMFEGKTVLKVQNTRFSQLSQVACKLLGLGTRTLKTKILKNFLSVFHD